MNCISSSGSRNTHGHFMEIRAIHYWQKSVDETHAYMYMYAVLTCTNVNWALTSDLYYTAPFKTCKHCLINDFCDSAVNFSSSLWLVDLNPICLLPFMLLKSAVMFLYQEPFSDNQITKENSTYWNFTLSTWNLVSMIPDVRTRHLSRSWKEQFAGIYNCAVILRVSK